MSHDPNCMAYVGGMKCTCPPAVDEVEQIRQLVAGERMPAFLGAYRQAAFKLLRIVDQLRAELAAAQSERDDYKSRWEQTGCTRHHAMETAISLLRKEEVRRAAAQAVIEGSRVKGTPAWQIERDELQAELAAAHSRIVEQNDAAVVLANELAAANDRYLALWRKTKPISDPCSGECHISGRCPHRPVCND